MSYKIGFAGTDGRTLLSALVTSTSTSEHSQNDFQGLVIRGMPAMAPFASAMKWPVAFIPTSDNSKNGYAAAITVMIFTILVVITAFQFRYTTVLEERGENV